MLAVVLFRSQSTAAFTTRFISSSIARITQKTRKSTTLSLTAMSKKRPGVEASARLVTIPDVNVWEQIEAQYDSIRKEKLLAAEQACKKSKVSDNDKFNNISKDQLLDIVQWKFAVGKPRPQNLGLLRGNTDAVVVKCSQDAIALAKDLSLTECVSSDGELTADGNVSIKKSLEELTKLRGVGPATATAVLYRVRPDIMCYMYDEVIDCFEPKRDYTMNVYLRINAKCFSLANTLGEGWTTARVARVLWIAARVLTDGGDDLTGFAASAKKKNEIKESSNVVTPPEDSGRKRRKTRR